MYQEISQLLMYGDLDEDSILAQMGEVFGKYETGEYNKTGLVRDINTQVKRILKVATDYGFDDNLWHNYLTFFLMMSENPFSMTCEKVGASDGSVNELVENDFRIFKDLFDYDFGPIEKDLGINCFSQISNYQAIHKKDLMYNKNVSEKVRSLSKKLEAAKDEKEFFDAVTGFIKTTVLECLVLTKHSGLMIHRREALHSVQSTIWIPLCWTIWSDMRFRKRSW